MQLFTFIILAVLPVFTSTVSSAPLDQNNSGIISRPMNLTHLEEIAKFSSKLTINTNLTVHDHDSGITSWPMNLTHLEENAKFSSSLANNTNLAIHENVNSGCFVVANSGDDCQNDDSWGKNLYFPPIGKMCMGTNGRHSFYVSTACPEAGIWVTYLDHNTKSCLTADYYASGWVFPGDCIRVDTGKAWKTSALFANFL